MTDKKWFIEDEDSAYGEGLLVDEYNGRWSVIRARKDNEGKVWMEWAYPQKRDGSKEPMEKSFPWGLKFGNSKEAAAAKLRELAEKIDSVPF